MLWDFIYIGIGLVLLVLGGDALVRGAVNLALRLGIPPLVVGLTVVAFGTSAPELLVSVQAVLNDAPGIALGNVVGSNIANILLVLGIPAVIATIHTSQLDLRRSYLTMLAASVLFVALCFAGPLTWWHALILLACLAAMIVDSYLDGKRKNMAAEDDLEGADPSMPWWKIIAFLIAGLVALPFGADYLVTGAVALARDFGVSETVIGLTLVAVGTSLPELATSIIAAFRKHAEVAMGNVIGSNVFNLLGIIGITGLVGQLPVPPEMLRYDLWVMLSASLIIFPFILMRRDITRVMGFGLIGLYAAYTVSLVA